MNHPVQKFTAKSQQSGFSQQNEQTQSTNKMNPQLLKAISITADLMGSDLNPELIKAFEMKLRQYPQEWVLKALNRCASEVSGKLTLAHVVTRVFESDGRPTPEEAWNMLPKDEGASVVWTDEMASAFGVIYDNMDDRVASRMGFIECYKNYVREARDKGVMPKWSLSPGFDSRGRDAALIDALDKKRVSLGYVLAHNEELSSHPSVTSYIKNHPDAILSLPARIQAMVDRNSTPSLPYSQEVSDGLRRLSQHLRDDKDQLDVEVLGSGESMEQFMERQPSEHRKDNALPRQR